MTKTEFIDRNELRGRLEAFTLDEAGIEFPFSARLARENAWSRPYTRRVIEEYKRFILLAMTAGHPVTPSVDVDQAWHLHLTYTRSYWDDLCANILNAPLHHQPTKGGSREGEKFHDWYARTLESYERVFDSPPPADIWPPPRVRLSAESRIRQVSDRTHWVIRKPRLSPLLPLLAILIVPLLIMGCGRDEMPIVLGSAFILAAIGLVASPILKRSYRRSNNGEPGGGDHGIYYVGDSGDGSGDESGGGSSGGDHGSDGGHGVDSGSHGGADSGGHGVDSGGHGGADSGGADSSGSDGGSGCSGCGGCGGCGG